MSTATTLSAPEPWHERRAQQHLLFRLCALGVGLLAVSPLASFALCGFLLINLARDTPPPVRWVLDVALALALALMAGARPLDPGELGDIEGYYDVYLAIADGDLSELTHFGGGFEVALPLLMLLWATLLPPLSLNGLMFCMALTSSLMLVLWVERAFYRGDNPAPPALAGICLVLLNIYFATQLSRQFLALIMLLYVFTAAGRSRRMLFLALAMSFHLTALPFYGVYLLARRGWMGWVAILAAALLLRLYFVQLLAAFDVLPEVATEKLLYYVDNPDETTAADIGSLRMVFLLAVISIVVLVASRLRPDPRTRPWLAVPWLTAAVHTLLLPIPLVSLRATLMVHSVASGLIAYQMLSGRARRLRMPALNLLLLYKTAAFALAAGGANLRPSLVMAGSFFQ